MTSPDQQFEILVPPENSLTLQMLAEQAGTDVFDYMGQALALACECVDQYLINEKDGHVTRIYFGSAEAGYEEYSMPVEFEPSQDSPVESELLMTELEIASQQPAIKAGVTIETAELILGACESLGMSWENFMDFAIFLRWNYQLTHDGGGEVLIDHGSDETCRVVDMGFDTGFDT